MTDIKDETGGSEKLRVLVVDDAVSSGNTMVSVMGLLRRVGANVVRVVVAMRQGNGWQRRLADFDPGLPALVHGVFDTPHLSLTEDGWLPIPETFPDTSV